MSYHFIFAVDPGITTGLAYGIVDRFPGATASDLIAEYGNDVTVEEVYEKDEVKAGIEICTLFLAKRAEMMATTRPRCAGVHLVIEDFQIRPGGMPSSKRSTLAPVRVTAAIEAMLLMKRIPMKDGYTRLSFQQPSSSMKYATNARIKKEWEIWQPTVGKEHGRDALRHWCAKVASMITMLSAPGSATTSSK